MGGQDAKIQEELHSRDVGRTRRILVASLACVLLISGACLLAGRWRYTSRVQRIASIDARYTPRPEENAARLYDELIARGVPTGNPAEPSLPADALATLIAATRVERCWFPLSAGTRCYDDHVRYLRPARDWGLALLNGADEDVARARIDRATEMLRGALGLSAHLQQQALRIDFGKGTALETVTWRYLAEFIMQPDASEEMLNFAETVPSDLEADWREACQLVLEVQPLISASVLAEQSLREKVRTWWIEFRGGFREEETLRLWFLRALASRRGGRLLVALRRYHDAHGQWPEKLHDVASLIPEQALVDPYTGQPFVYRVDDGVPWLYSRGANGIDENGASIRPAADDWRIWPPYRYRTRGYR